MSGETVSKWPATLSNQSARFYHGMAATLMFEAVFAVQNITDLAPAPIDVVIADRAAALWAPRFLRTRGSYRQHATKGIDMNKGDPSGSSASL
jgi:hypothetical protein